MKKGKLLSLLLAAVVGAGSLAMTAQAAPAELPAQTAKTAAFVKASDWVLKDDWAIFALGRNQEEGCEKLYEDYYQGVLALLADPAKLIISGFLFLLPPLALTPGMLREMICWRKLTRRTVRSIFRCPPALWLTL